MNVGENRRWNAQLGLAIVFKVATEHKIHLLAGYAVNGNRES